jgi:hypothetical protein
MDYRLRYKEILTKGRTISKNNIEPRNIYRIQTYRGGDPNSSERFVFVVGIVENKIHCLKLNEIPPKDFISFLNRIVDKRVKLDESVSVNEIVKKFNDNGKDIFEYHIKGFPQVYNRTLKSYRIYKSEKISNVSEMFFESGLLEKFFDIKVNETLRDIAVEKEIDEKDG